MKKHLDIEGLLIYTSYPNPTEAIEAIHATERKGNTYTQIHQFRVLRKGTAACTGSAAYSFSAALSK